MMFSDDIHSKARSTDRITRDDKIVSSIVNKKKKKKNRIEGSGCARVSDDVISVHFLCKSNENKQKITTRNGR